MENITEFVQQIQDMTRDADDVKIIEINGDTYVNRGLTRVIDHTPKSVSLTTLSGLANIIKKERETYKVPLFVIVNSPTSVIVSTTLLVDLDRDIPYSASINPDEFSFGRQLDIESFIIGVRSKFVPTPDSQHLIELLSSLKSDEGVNLADDGVTQNVTVTKGISMAGVTATRPIVKLQPYRTFNEVEQPASEFLFRLSDKGAGVTAALYEADGNAWEYEAMQNIASRLELLLVDTTDVTVIA